VIEGLDLSNTVWLRTNYEMCDPDDECKPVWPEGSCPRTIGYWKNNFKKVLDGAKAQETRASLEWGLRNTALASQIFQKGLVSADLQTINVAVQTSNQPLTLEEAYKILQRSTNQQSPYFTNLEANSMMARALQQNLATWMNLATGKIGPTTVVRLTGIAGGDFNGTVEQALQEAEQRILNNDNLERAKDIADMINNNSLNQDPANVIPCEEYNKPTGPIPSDKQPPAHEKMPKAPKPENKKESDTPPTTPEDPATCTGRTNTDQVENTTNNPFFSIKFNFASGTEIKEGLYEEFRYSLPADTVAGISQMQVEAKAGEESRTVTLACDFTSPLPCDAVKDADGTLELVFQVYVHGQYGLSHASFELPGIAASAPASGSYEAKVCQP
jgi:hypothetical protein